MRSTFVGYFRPSAQEFSQHWRDSIFVFDANVLLNLYRYSADTKAELKKAIGNVSDRVFIPHQAAKEFLKNRLTVTIDQSTEYKKLINQINQLVDTLSQRDRHPFLPEENLPSLKENAELLISILETQQSSLLKNLSEDDTLDFIEGIFIEKTGKPYPEEKLKEISDAAIKRFDRKIPPGYKDAKKDATEDIYRPYGDLIIWNQIIDHSVEQKKPIIFVTDDKK